LTQLVLPDFNNLHGEPSIFQMEGGIHEVLSNTKSNYFSGKFQYLHRSDKKDVILYHIRDRYYGIVNLKPDVAIDDSWKSSTVRSIPMNVSKIEDIVDKCAVQVDEQNMNLTSDPRLNDHISNFSMAPPTKQSLQRPTKPVVFPSPQYQDDPLMFIYSRYFSILYSLTTPLSYFPKTSLARVKILCDNEQEKLSQTLEKLYLSIEEMDSRHQGKHGILTNLFTEIESVPTMLKTKIEYENQLSFVTKHSDLIDKVKSSLLRAKRIDSTDDDHLQNHKNDGIAEEMLSSLILQLKIREAQLQVILIFEILCSWNISEEEFLENSIKKYERELKKKDREAKKSLVRKRKQPRKIIPTFLGMGVNISDSPIVDQQCESLNEYTVYKCLNALVDRLGLWDTLLGNSNTNDNAYGFLGYVLVPYYNKKLPIVLKYVVDKVKDLNMKLSFVSKSKPKLDTKSSLTSPKNQSSPQSEAEIKEVRRNSKYNKTLLRKPELRKSATIGSLNDNDLLPAFAIKRSKSNLSSKNLQKRQVDMSVNGPKKESSKPNVGRSKSLSEATQAPGELLIFGNASRIKPSSIRKPSKIPQIEATPVKARVLQSLSQIKATPLKHLSMDTSPGADRTTSIPEIQATPMTNSRISEHFIVTPDDRNNQQHIIDSTKRPSVANRLFTASLDPPFQESNSTSEKHVSETPIAKRFNQGVNKTPVPMNHTNNDRTLINENIQSHSIFTTSLPVPDTNPILSSPIMGIDSPSNRSPVRNTILDTDPRKRRRPGEPASIQDSPFFNTYVQESTIEHGIFKRGRLNSLNDTRVKENEHALQKGEETDPDSDYERLMPKKSVRTYSKRK
jgi:DNA replication regulator SLD3